MSKKVLYREELRKMAKKDWDDYLLKNSGLPGRRGNIELGQAFALEGDRVDFERYLEYKPDIAPVNSPGEFLAFCGVLGYGRLLSEGDDGFFQPLRACVATSATMPGKKTISANFLLTSRLLVK